MKKYAPPDRAKSKQHPSSWDSADLLRSPALSPLPPSSTVRSNEVFCRDQRAQFLKGDGKASMCRGVRVLDEWTFVCGLWIRNRSIVLVLASLQLVVACVSFAQHIYSVVKFRNIFLCSFNSTSDTSTTFLSSDVIIFDFRLFHKLIKVQECIANYLDGGYMRCLWCVGYILALSLTILTILCIRNAHPLFYWPLLIMQNSYCFGLVILTIATADKILVALLQSVNPQLNLLIFYFFIGTFSNHIFDYILWHFYWHEEFVYIGRTGKHVIPFWV